MVSLEKSVIVDSFPIYWNAQKQAWVMLIGSKRVVLSSKFNTQLKARNFSIRAYNACLQGYIF